MTKPVEVNQTIQQIVLSTVDEAFNQMPIPLISRWTDPKWLHQHNLQEIHTLLAKGVLNQRLILFHSSPEALTNDCSSQISNKPRIPIISISQRMMSASITRKFQQTYPIHVYKTNPMTTSEEKHRFTSILQHSPIRFYSNNKDSNLRDTTWRKTNCNT